MDNQLLLGLLFVTVSWGFMGTYAQSSTNMTTPGIVNGSTTTVLPNSATMSAAVNATAPSTSMSPASASANMANNTATTPGTAVASSTNMTNNALTTKGNTVTSSTNMTNNTSTMTGSMVTSSTNMTNNTSTMTGSMVTSSTNMTNNTSTTKGNTVTSSTNMTNNTSTMTGSMVTSSTNMTNNTSTTKGTTVTSSTNMTNNTSTMTGSMVTSSTNMTNNTSTTTGTTVTSSTNMTNNTSTVTAVLVLNTTVETLQTNISRAGCGTTFLCAAQPSMCDPSSGGSCFFLGAKPNGANFDFELSGMSDGYIAATVSTAATLGNNDTTFVCARKGQGVQFFGARLIGNRLTKFPVFANSVRGRAIGNLIQCAFLATVPTPQTRASVYSVSVSTGTYNETSGDLGNTTDVIRATGVNLADSNATVTNDITANTTAAPTTASTTTTSAATTIPVGALLTPISRTNCGSTKLCAAQPSACNPATGVGCFFISAQQQSGQLYNFELSGESSGYVAAGVSTSSNANGTHQAYVCANNNGAVTFFTGTITNLVLSLTPSNASNVKGAINSRKIQCTFAATLPDTTVRAASYALSVSNGTYSPATGMFGNPLFLIFTNRVNLSDPTSNATNQISNGAYPATYQQPLIPALLVTVVMLTFSMM